MTKKDFKYQCNQLEKKIGMTSKEYNEKLDSQIEEKKKLCDSCMKIILEQLENQDFTITNISRIPTKKKTYTLKEDEQIKPCFSPDPVRKELPYNLAITSNGILIKVYMKDDRPTRNIYLVVPDECTDRENRGYISFMNYATQKNKRIKAYSLSNLIFGTKPFDKNTIKLLSMFGSYAFGSDNDLDLQCHHPLKVSDYPDLSYIPENTQILQRKQHTVLKNLESEVKKCLDVPAIKNKLKYLNELCDTQIQLIISSDNSTKEINIDRLSFGLIEKDSDNLTLPKSN